MTGKHIELFLVEGVPGGITTAEIAGWTGHVLAGPRSNLGDILKRPEARRNGAYLLLGDDEEALGGVRCYIGAPRTSSTGSGITRPIRSSGTGRAHHLQGRFVHRGSLGLPGVASRGARQAGRPRHADQRQRPAWPIARSTASSSRAARMEDGRRNLVR